MGGIFKTIAKRGTKLRQDVQAAFAMEAFQKLTTGVSKSLEATGKAQERARVDVETAKVLEQKRKPLRLRGRRSTIRTRVTPDIFASSLGAPKTLLGA